MINYTIATRKSADSDGDFMISLRVNSQDEAQVADMYDVSFKASNGWTVSGGKRVVLNVEQKRVSVLGALGKNTYQHGFPFYIS